MDTNASSRGDKTTGNRPVSDPKKSAAPPQSPGDPKANPKDGPGAGPARPRPNPNIIRDGFIPAMLQLAAGNDPSIDGAAFRAYRDALVREAKVQDIFEQTLMEGVVLAHLSAFRLLGSVGLPKTAEGVGIYASAAVKLLGEARRTIVAIKELRSPPSPSKITVATSQQVHVTASPATEPSADTAKKSDARSEQGSNNAPGTNRMRKILEEELGGAQEPAAVGAID